MCAWHRGGLLWPPPTIPGRTVHGGVRAVHGGVCAVDGMKNALNQLRYGEIGLNEVQVAGKAMLE